MKRCCRGHRTHNHRLLTSLRKSIVDSPPYISGTLQLPEYCFSLFYKVARDGNAARCINFANATPDELGQLTQACEVIDEAYSKAGKMDSEYFSSSLDPFRTDLIKIIRGYLLEGDESRKNMAIETYKLNIYSKGSSFKPHVDTPQSKKMFGSLMIVFPTHHEGGALFVRHRGHEWIFDPGQALAGGTLDRPSIGYLAFLNDIEQDVSPVTSGHCVTLTYNLYFDDDGGPVSGKDAVSKHLIPPKPPNQDGFREAFKALLENPEFMAEGGTLAFGLRHGYPIKYDLKPIYNILKRSDAVVYQCVRALGFEPTLYMYYDGGDDFSEHQGMILDKVVNLKNVFFDPDEDPDEQPSAHEIIQAQGGILMRQDGGRFYEDDDLDSLMIPEPMEWVTPRTTYNHKEDGNELWGYPISGDACMIVRIGKAGDRLAYPTVAQIEKTYKQSGYGRE
ncbi:hypothetical protein F5888DRAFT_1655292 [Russula emetica]|nr:hypothetical protein F5888DRAFT_1655292 [Russula emetica]